MIFSRSPKTLLPDLTVITPCLTGGLYFIRELEREGIYRKYVGAEEREEIRNLCLRRMGEGGRIKTNRESLGIEVGGQFL